MKNNSRNKRNMASSAKRQYSTHYSSMRGFFTQHLQACVESFGRLSRQPFATMMTIAVIGVSLALPMGLLLLLANVQKIAGSWDNSVQVSLFLDVNASPQIAMNLLQRLRRNPRVAQAYYISPEQGLTDLQKVAGFGDLVNALPDNPLPAVIEVKPALSVEDSPAAIERFLQELQQYPQVDLAQLDMQWVKRLYSMLAIAERGTLALAILLALGVVLVIGNTIRLATENYREQISIIKLIGASNRFIRRPFLYTGLLYGVLGGGLAWLSIDFIIMWLQKPVISLALSYDSHFQMKELSLGSMVLLAIIGGFLGYMGAWIAVNRHLAQIDLE